MSLLGLGDVVLPGLFIALILRFDENRKPGSRTYFYTVLVAYLIGLAATYVAMIWSEHAQPGNFTECPHVESLDALHTHQHVGSCIRASGTPRRF